MNKSSKRFRFDSFATEFSEDKQDIPDNDSGIGKFLNCDNFDELDYWIMCMNCMTSLLNNAMRC